MNTFSKNTLLLVAALTLSACVTQRPAPAPEAAMEMEKDVVETTTNEVIPDPVPAPVIESDDGPITESELQAQEEARVQDESEVPFVSSDDPDEATESDSGDLFDVGNPEVRDPLVPEVEDGGELEDTENQHENPDDGGPTDEEDIADGGAPTS